MKLYFRDRDWIDRDWLADPLRIALRHAQVPFDDIRLDLDDFERMRDDNLFEGGMLPMLDMFGRRLNQSQSILRYLGRKYDFYPQD